MFVLNAVGFFNAELADNAEIILLSRLCGLRDLCVERSN